MTEGTFHAPAARLAWFSDAIVAAVADSRAPLRVLDVGCGAGDQIFDLAARLPAADFVGVDIAAENITQAERRRAGNQDAARIRFEYGDYREFAAAAPFDVVFSYSVLQFVPGGSDVLARRIVDDLARGGVFVNAMPFRCAYNTRLATVRRLLHLVKSPMTDRMLLSAARRLHGATLDTALLEERIGYMYEAPLQYDEDLTREGERLGLRTLRREPVPHASAAQLKHALRVMRAP